MQQKIDNREVYQELEERLHEELDYVNEAKNIALFQRMFRDDPEVVIPQVYPELSSRRVLTMSRIEGYPLADVMKPGIDQDLKDWVALKYFRVTWRQIFEFGTLHTDPHPGNYLVTFHPRLALLDFGSVRVFPENIRAAYLGLAQGLLARDRAQLTSCLVRLGFLDRGDDPAGMIEILELIFEPMLVDKRTDPRKYDSLEKGMAAATLGFEHRLFKAPGHRVFLLRALIGLDSYLKHLGAVANWHRVFKACVAAAS